jgi:hypothetical protein
MQKLALLIILVIQSASFGGRKRRRRGTLMRHFSDVRAIDRLGKLADFSLSHGAVQSAAEQVLADIATFGAKRHPNAKVLQKNWVSLEAPGVQCANQMLYLPDSSLTTTSEIKGEHSISFSQNSLVLYIRHNMK